MTSEKSSTEMSRDMVVLKQDDTCGQKLVALSIEVYEVYADCIDLLATNGSGVLFSKMLR